MAIRIVSSQRSFLGKLVVKLSRATNIAGIRSFFDIDKLCRSFNDLGKTLGKTGMFDQRIVATLARPRKISRTSYWIAKTAVTLYIGINC